MTKQVSPRTPWRRGDFGEIVDADKEHVFANAKYDHDTIWNQIILPAVNNYDELVAALEKSVVSARSWMDSDDKFQRSRYCSDWLDALREAECLLAKIKEANRC